MGRQFLCDIPFFANTVGYAITNSFCNKSRCYNERMLQRTVFINKIRILQRT